MNMENPIRRNLYDMGEALRTIGGNMCEQAKSQEDLDYRIILMPSLLDFFNTPSKLIDELNSWREEEVIKRKNQRC